ncbi:tetratricopeptide repeat protein [Sinorhizobium medicae]|nr:tetratricopeptide repeat protein [Sinorhizobium medicae]TWA42499.1 tetratricopeptide repeat protein [Sinorhizobium medicae]TWA44062.1 tetratricopeptide repeat protein [Sinorhizobium medicae]
MSRSDLDQGKLQFMNGNYGLAEKHFREAVELRRDNAEALMGLAACYDRLGRFDLADRTYSQLLKVAGRQPRIVNNMGYSHYLRGEKAKARTLLLEARAALPGDNTIEANLALLDRS